MMTRDNVNHPRLRILMGKTIALGPGKADLLDAISQSGSISAAARKMNMSYSRAWKLIEAMNRDFRFPLVVASSGGSGGGGTQLTDTGAEALKRYRCIEQKAASSVADEINLFTALLLNNDKNKYEHT